MNAWNLTYALPECLLAFFSMIVLMKDATSPPDNKRAAVRLAHIGVLVATLWVLGQGIFLDLTPRLYAFHGHYGLDAFAVTLKVIFGLTALFVMAMADTWFRRVDRGHAEFHLLVMFATMGMFFTTCVEDFATLFVSLELITISFYVLTAFKRNDERSVEAAVKYIILGAVASAFLLLGIAFIYGASGSLMLRDLGTTQLSDALGSGSGALVRFGVLLTLVGLGFKIAAVPFQVWAPDVYQGASSPVTAFLSMGSKAAGFVLILKVVRACMGPAGDAGIAVAAAWIGVLGVITGATVLYGNLGAMWQKDIKRLLGYSSIGHAGYLLMGILAFNQAGFAAVVYYLAAYFFTVLSVFGVVVIVSGVTRSHRIDDYAGLGRRSPFLGLVMTIGLLSLAGVPPLGGFFGKFLVFTAILGTKSTVAYVLAFIGIFGIVVSLYYYLGVVKRIYMDEPQESARGEDFHISRPMKMVLYTCMIGILLMGIFQAPFVSLANSAADALMAAP